jgi:hypothetical protein
MPRARRRLLMCPPCARAPNTAHPLPPIGAPATHLHAVQAPTLRSYCACTPALHTRCPCARRAPMQPPAMHPLNHLLCARARRRPTPTRIMPACCPCCRSDLQSPNFLLASCATQDLHTRLYTPGTCHQHHKCHVLSVSRQRHVSAVPHALQALITSRPGDLWDHCNQIAGSLRTQFPSRGPFCFARSLRMTLATLQRPHSAPTECTMFGPYAIITYILAHATPSSFPRLTGHTL